MPYIHIDSAHLQRLENINSLEADFTYQLSQPINGVVKTNLKYARFDQIPNVITNYNDKVYLFSNTTGGTMLTATLPTGYFTGDELAAALAAAMTTAASPNNVFNIVFNQNNRKLTITGTETWTFPQVSTVATSFNAPDSEIWQNTSNLIGNQVLTSAFTLAKTLQFEVDLTPVKYLAIELTYNGYSNNEIVSRHNSFSYVVPNIVQNIQDPNQQQLNYKEEYFSQVNHVSKVNINKLDIKISLNDGSAKGPIPITPDKGFLDGKRWELMLECEQSQTYAYVGLSRR